MRTIEAQGSYTVGKEFTQAGQEVTFEFSYPVFDTLAEAVSQLGGEVKALAMLNQTHKEDCRNNASGKAKSDNGHSTRVAMTEEQKIALKAKRSEDRQTLNLLEALKAQGLNLEDLKKQYGI
jgi:hypothetical protein